MQDLQCGAICETEEEMSAIQPSIVARLKPELVPEVTQREYLPYGEYRPALIRKWQPMEYKDQILDLLPDEDAHPYQTSELGSVFAHIVCVRTEGKQKSIRVQFHHKIEA